MGLPHTHVWRSIGRDILATDVSQKSKETQPLTGAPQHRVPVLRRTLPTKSGCENQVVTIWVR